MLKNEFQLKEYMNNQKKYIVKYNQISPLKIL